MRKTLVTGATGFIGCHLVRKLVERGDQVRCLVRQNSRIEQLQPLSVEFCYGGVLDEHAVSEAVGDAELVFHLAGITSAMRVDRMMKVNGEGTRTVAQACADSGCSPTLLVVSSIAAGGPARRGSVRTEADPPVPVSRYGRSKRMGEEFAESLAGEVATSIVRPGIVFGPGDKELLPVFRSIHRFRAHFTAGLRTPALSPIHVADLVELLLCVADQGQRLSNPQAGGPAGQGYYYAAAEECPSFAEWGNIIKGVLHRPFAPTIPIPVPLAWLIAWFAEVSGRARGKSSTFNTDKIGEARAASWACSAEKVRSDLGFEFPCSLTARIEQTAEAYRRAGLL